MRKTVVYTASRKLYPLVVPAVKSLLMNSTVDHVYLLIEDEVFPYGLPPCVEVKNVSGQEWFKPDGANARSKFTYFSMLRAVLCYLIPDDCVLSLDIDTIVVEDVAALWKEDMNGYYFSAAQEPVSTEQRGFFYANTGVAFYNLREMEKVADKAVFLLNEMWTPCLEQDVLNCVCRGYVKEMPPEYNKTNYTKPCIRPKIYHYAGLSDWSREALVMRFWGIPWEEVMKNRR